MIFMQQKPNQNKNQRLWRLEVWGQGVSRFGFFWRPWGKDLFQAPLLGCLLPVSLHSLTSLPICVLVFSYMNTSHIGLALTHWLHVALNAPLGLVSKYSHILRDSRLTLQQLNLRGHNNIILIKKNQQKSIVYTRVHSFNCVFYRLKKIYVIIHTHF